MSEIDSEAGLVARLRTYRTSSEWGEAHHPICDEAADRIAALVAENAELRERVSANARTALRDLMSEISEQYYCAGWLIGLERSLWEMAFEGGSPRFGMGEVTLDQIFQLRALAHEGGVWWHWPDAAFEAEPIALAHFRAALSDGGDHAR